MTTRAPTVLTVLIIIIIIITITIIILIIIIIPLALESHLAAQALHADVGDLLAVGRHEELKMDAVSADQLQHCIAADVPHHQARQLRGACQDVPEPQRVHSQQGGS